MNRLLFLFRRGLVYWLPLLVLFAAATARLVIPHLLDRLSLVAFDLYQRIEPRKASADPPVLVVDIDESSLKRIGQWPWPRTMLAQLVERLHHAGAAAIGFDIMLSEHDRTAPQALLALTTGAGIDEAEARRVLAAMPNPDARLAAAMAKAPVVVGFAMAPTGGTAQPIIKAGIAAVGARGANPWRFVDRIARAVPALPPFEKAAAGDGFFNEPPDFDNIVRSVPLILRLGNRPVPSFAAEVLRVGLGGHGYIVRYAGAQAARSFGENTGVNAVQIPVPQAHTAVTVETDARGRVTLHFARTDRRRYISAADILSGHFDPKRVAGHIVLVGSSAAGLSDLKATPLAPDVPGVEIHAQLIDQILLGGFLTRPDWAAGMEILFALVMGVIVIVAVPRLGALPSAGFAGIAMIVAVALSWFAFRDARLLIDPVYPMAVLATVYFSSTLLTYRLTERRQREIRQAFSLYLAPQLVEELAQHPEKLVLGGETRLMTIMFCDIRGFTTLSEGMGAHELGQLINDFLTPMTEIVMAHKGTIDKYIGDCIMAFWNAPLDDPEHAKNAVAAAQDMRAKLAELNAAWAVAGRRNLHIGIGINTGECSVGNFGSHQKFNYSLLGDPVNLASRLEGLTKLYGVDLIIGEETAEQLDEPGLIELDLVAVKGKKNAVRIYTLPPHPVEARQYLARHAALLDAYRHRDWERALRLLEDPVLAAERDMAPVYGLFRERIAQMRVESPPSDWDGVFVAHEK